MEDLESLIKINQYKMKLTLVVILQTRTLSQQLTSRKTR